MCVCVFYAVVCTEGGQEFVKMQSRAHLLSH